MDSFNPLSTGNNTFQETLNRSETRKTTRTTAGVPPQRFGESNPTCQNQPHTSSNLLSDSRLMGTRPPNSSTHSISGTSGRSQVTVRTSRSYSSAIQQTQIDVQTEEEINALEDQCDTNEREAQTLELEVKTIIDTIEQMKTDIEKIPEEQELEITQLREQLVEMQRNLAEKQTEVTKKRIDISFEMKTLQRKKAQIRRKAELQKQIVREDEINDVENLSQRLSDSEEEAETSSVFLARQRLQLQEQLARQMKSAETALNKTKTTPIPNLNDDELLIRLRKLQQPIGTDTHEATREAGPVHSAQTETNGNNSDFMSDQFAQVLAKTFEKISNNSSSTDKFLARQVQGKDLPHFYGRPEEWSLFITAFENTTQGCGYNNQDNLPRLQKCLKGEAAKTVQCLLARSENVPAIMAKLKMRFGRPEHIVQMLIAKAKEVPAFRDDRLDLLIDFGLAVDNLVETIKALNCREHLTSPQLLEEFSKKLPVSHRTRWIEWVTSDPHRKENLETFAEWMSKQTEVACRLCPPRWKEEQPQKRPDHWKVRRKDERVWAAAAASSKTPKPYSRETNCLFCQCKGHQVLQCPKFEKEEIEERWKWVKSNRHCFCCLKFGHSVRECRKKKDCGIQGCQKSHHGLLHQQTQQQPIPPLIVDTITHATRSSSKKDSSHINLMILPVYLKGPKGNMSTFAFLDPGATVTVIDNNVANALGLEGEIVPFSHSGLHPTITERNSRMVNLEIQSYNGNKKFHLQKVRTVEKLSLPQQSVRVKLLKKWSHLKGINIQTYEEGLPTILIGQDNLHLCNTRELILGPPNAPGAGRTELGWVLMGKVEGLRDEFTFVINNQSDDALHKLVKEHFTTEDFGVKVTYQNQRSKEDIRGQAIMDSTIKQNGDSWEIGLLWKSDDVTLPNTKDIAKSRLFQMERRMDRDPVFAEKYLSKINEYQNKGFARVLKKEEADKEGPRTFYLPHFMSKNPKKPTKLRFIFDAAAKTQGISLNDTLLKGPDKLTILPSVLFKFRQRAVALNADIKDMFHRVRVRPEDACSQRFLWRGMDRNREPDIMEMGVLIFGSACSPACAQEVKNLNASKFKEQFPESAEAIIVNHYVDDYLDSVDTLEEAIKRYQQVRDIHQSGGFNICNWISNNRDLLAVIPETLHAPGVKSLDLEGDAERVLGLFWRPDVDQFTFSMTFLKANEELINGNRLPTKRELLSLVMSIFDPLGFLALFTIKAKIILQETWKTGIGWDDEIPGTLGDKWEKWRHELIGINKFKLPRCYSPDLSTAEDVQLHIFCDASEQAFGAVAYLRMQKSGFTTVSFVAAKSKVAPTKYLTIPKLELQAALLGTRLGAFIKKEHNIQIHKTIYWSDSSTVLSWIRADGKKFVQFVANRVGEIQEATDVQNWRWVPTKKNVADELTRDNQPSDFAEKSRWINGPDFLNYSEEDWPQPPSIIIPISEDQLELKKEHICTITQIVPLVDINRFSKWSRAVRTIGYVFRFIKNCQKVKKDRSILLELSHSEVVNAESWWWRTSQSENFAIEMHCLKNNKALPRSSRLLQLNPVLDDESIIRLHGRIDNANVCNFTKQPIILDPFNRLTKLLILHYHELGNHHGHEKIVNELRQKFHIINIRAAVKRASNECQRCKNIRAEPVLPMMGQLPPSRLEGDVSVFKNTGLDYFGPISVAVGRRREKRWGALFTCLSTRAVHIELTSSLSTDSCIMAVRRFVSRRGCPTDIYSDNGTNFIGANNELKKSLQELNQEQITSECTSKGITWHFIPPSAPHMGGSWERLVKSVKIALAVILKETTPREEVLQTVIAEAEHVVNCHPLTHVPIDPDDPEALTPNHFLIGRSSNLQPPGRFDDRDLCSRKQWRRAQQLANQFWKRWIKEYIPTLLRRGKWFAKTDSLKVGDVVLVVDNQLTRNSWPMGRVEKVYPGDDGAVRVVDVRTTSGVYRRAVAKLCKLDVLRNEVSQDLKIQDDIP